MSDSIAQAIARLRNIHKEHFMADMHADLDAWLDQVREEIIEPERPIIDPHHHLWKHRFGHDYLLPELWADTGSGHNIVKTAFM
ncbi:MAG: hypothetical protein IIC10_10285, partial [Proteobacteria bacterium]|nr:hypothetical protein [Pseudomonadota bacterium]